MGFAHLASFLSDKGLLFKMGFKPPQKSKWERRAYHRCLLKKFNFLTTKRDCELLDFSHTQRLLLVFHNFGSITFEGMSLCYIFEQIYCLNVRSASRELEIVVIARCILLSSSRQKTALFVRIAIIFINDHNNHPQSHSIAIQQH